MTTTANMSRNARPFLHNTDAVSAAVSDVLDSGVYGHGPVVEVFERELADYLGVPDVVTVASGSVALQIALLASGIGPGEEVIVPSLTFAASIQAIIASGAQPRFAEVAPETLCITATSVNQALTPATRAVMPVLYGGRAVDLTEIQDTLTAQGIVLVEDAAHAFGSYQGPLRVGATGALTCFSFDPIKNLTCGEGGAIVPRTPQEAQAARTLRCLGIAASPAQRAQVTSYTVEDLGLRAHLSSLNAAIGRVQLAHFADAQIRRTNLWRAYAHALNDVPNVDLVDVDIEHTTPFNCVIRVPAPLREDVFGYLRRHDVGVGVPYPPNHLQPAFARWHRNLPVTEQVAREIISLPFHPAMTTENAHQAITMLKQALDHATRFGREIA